MPDEIGNLNFASDRVTLTWNPSSPGVGVNTWYDILQPTGPLGSGSSDACVASGIPVSMFPDSAVPPAGGVLYYLVRAHNVCGAGPYGFRSDGIETTSATCP